MNEQNVVARPQIKPAAPVKVVKPSAPRVIPEKKWLTDMETMTGPNPLNWRPAVLQAFLHRPTASNPSRLSWSRKLS